MSALYTVTTYGCREYLCRMGLIAGILERRRVVRLAGIEDIQAEVADYYEIPPYEMTSAARARDVARPRQIAIYLTRHLTRRSLPEIGRRFGGRDHTTVIHAIRQVEKFRHSDADFDADVRRIIQRLAAKHPNWEAARAAMGAAQ